MKKFKAFICIILCLSLLPICYVSAAGATKIYTETQLKAISSNLSGNYVLENDIVLSSSWIPVGNSSNYFTGTFDGAGHTITINLNTTKDSKGLFGYAIGATFSNLTMKGEVTIYSASGDVAYSNVGSICGGAKSCTFNNCINEATVKGNKYVGGICGRAFDSSFTNCVNNGTVIADEGAGGIIGRSAGSTVRLCVNNGPISANTSAGGICGLANQYQTFLNSTFEKCYNTKFITVNSSRGGGILGFAQSVTSGKYGNIEINDCFNLGAVNSDTPSAYLGGILGDCTQSESTQTTVNRCYNVGIISGTSHAAGIGGGEKLIYSNCYYLNNSSLPIGLGLGVTSVSANSMKQKATFTGFDFSSVWSLDSTNGYEYPFLKGLPFSFKKKIDSLEVKTFPYTQTYYKDPGLTLDSKNLSLKAYYNDGTIEDNITTGFTIKNPSFYLGLNPVVVTYKNATTFYPIYVYNDLYEKESLNLGGEYYIPLYSQTNLENISYFPNGHYFLMNDILCDSNYLGACSEEVPFGGILLGNGHKITVDIVGGNCAGLFNKSNGATVRDVSISGSVKGNCFVGGIVGYAINTEVVTCSSSAVITANASGDLAYSGGLIGYSNYTSGTFNLTSCHNFGDISLSSSAKKSSVGGLIGGINALTNNSVKLTGCSNDGAIFLDATSTSNENFVGGLVGIIYSPSGICDITIGESYNTGDINIDSSTRYVYAGGIAGDITFASSPHGSFLVKNSFNIGDITVNSNPLQFIYGGIVSSLSYSSASLQNCYNIGKISAPNTTYASSITSSKEYQGSVQNCYYIYENDKYGTKITEPQSLLSASYDGFDFSSVWEFSGNYNHPNLVSNKINESALNLISSVSIIGDVEYGSLVNSDIDSGVVYNWYIGTTPVDYENSNCYNIASDDIGKTLSLSVTGIGKNIGKANSAGSTVEKQSVIITSAPTLIDATGRTLTFDAVGYEYSFDNSVWYDLGTISGLRPNKDYLIYFRTKETVLSKSSNVISEAFDTVDLLAEEIDFGSYSTDSSELWNVVAGTSIDSFADNIDFEGLTLKVYNGSSIVTSGLIKTGYTVDFVSADESVICSFTVSVLGDTDGDGTVTNNDSLVIRKYIINIGSMPSLHAADMNNDGTVDARDSILIKQYSAK